jgi:hypothetical protein
MWKVILLCAVCAGCAHLPQTEETLPQPSPFKGCEVDWKVLVVGDRAYVALSYEDNVKLAVCFADIKRYILQLQDRSKYVR